jgi:hypothetical protein
MQPVPRDKGEGGLLESAFSCLGPGPSSLKNLVLLEGAGSPQDLQ